MGRGHADKRGCSKEKRNVLRNGILLELKRTGLSKALQPGFETKANTGINDRNQKSWPSWGET